jgi:hypothetical protein
MSLPVMAHRSSEKVSSPCLKVISTEDRHDNTHVPVPTQAVTGAMSITFVMCSRVWTHFTKNQLNQSNFEKLFLRRGTLLDAARKKTSRFFCKNSIDNRGLSMLPARKKIRKTPLVGRQNNQQLITCQCYYHLISVHIRII